MAAKKLPALADAAIFESIGELNRPIPASFMPDLGLYTLTLREAGELVAVDMWFSSELPAIEGLAPEDDVSPRDPALLAGLSKAIDGLTARLCAALDSGRLKPAYLSRDLNDRILPEHTRVTLAELRDWLWERGYYPGEFFDDRELLEQQIVEFLSDLLEDLRAKAHQDRNVRFGEDPETELLNALAEKARLQEQIRRLEAGAASQVDRPIGTRQRRTLLTVIAALCGEAKIDYRSRGAAQRIRELTESLGAPIDADTIRQHLADIQDALEVRMK